MSKLLWLTAIAVVFPFVASAQTNAIVNPVYRRAQGLVNDGNAVAGRALVDSMLSVAVQGSNEYAEGVYWRAVLSATAADAEMDYRRIVVDYPQSPRVEDALIRLAQLEIARANYDAALRHLNTLVTEHPESPARGRAGYWLARALFDKNDIPGGCAANADALARTSEDDAELRNQISYLNQRCAGVVLTQPSTVAVSPAAATQQPVMTAPPVPPAPVVSVPVQAKPVLPPPAPVASAATTDPVMKKMPAGSVKPVLKSAPEKPAATTGNYSVQIAAYGVKSQASAMVAKLKKRGYEARVDGEQAPFRVRIGRYATSGQASAVQRSLKAKQIDGFVVQADTQ